MGLSLQGAKRVGVWLLPLFLSWSYATDTESVQRLGQSAVSVDAIYVIGMKRCEARWKRVVEWAASKNVSITPIYGTDFNTIDLHNPPIPVTGAPAKDTITAGQVGCTTSHIRTWRDAFQKNHSRIIVLEDDIRMSDSLMQRLPRVLALADRGSSRRDGKPWHYIYLRMHPTILNISREVWHGDLRVANPGWGTAAYLLSAPGIRYLLTRITSYSHPLDVQIELLQLGLYNHGAEFVALDACGLEEDGTFPVGCPKNIHEMPIADRGNCFFSGTQVGRGAFGKQMPGVFDQNEPGILGD